MRPADSDDMDQSIELADLDIIPRGPTNSGKGEGREEPWQR
jgi:hypothetical protein